MVLFPEQQPVVLVIDDERALADLYTKRLADGYTVRTAYTGQRGLDRLDESVDVVLLDRKMPGLSGEEVLRRIRERDFNTRVAMVTGVDPDFDVIEMGFHDYLVKPVSFEELHETVYRLVRLVAYDRSVQEFYALATKKAALEAEKSIAELEASDDYDALTAELEARRQHLAVEMQSLSHDDYTSLLQTPGLQQPTKH